jgi:hypothetical protein
MYNVVACLTLHPLVLIPRNRVIFDQWHCTLILWSQISGDSDQICSFGWIPIWNFQIADGAGLIGEMKWWGLAFSRRFLYIKTCDSDRTMPHSRVRPSGDTNQSIALGSLMCPKSSAHAAKKLRNLRIRLSLVMFGPVRKWTESPGNPFETTSHLNQLSQ